MIVPRPIDERINFAKYHAELWQSSPENIGLTLAEASALLALANACEDSQTAQVGAQDFAKAATLERDARLDEMTKELSNLIRKVKAFAATQEVPNDVYAAAELPAPKTPEELGDPENPTDAEVELNNSGEVALKWKGSLYAGTYFQIERRTIAVGNVISDWSIIGTTGKKVFTDTTVPAGVLQVDYRIRAFRGKKVSKNSTLASVPFGAEAPMNQAQGGGEMSLAA